MEDHKVKSLPEWSFTFVIGPKQESLGLREISEKILDKAISWAEQRKLGIGGGYKIKDDASCQKSEFNFGLTNVEDNRLISYQSAAELFSHMKNAATGHRCDLDGGFGEFDD